VICSAPFHIIQGDGRLISRIVVHPMISQPTLAEVQQHLDASSKRFINRDEIATTLGMNVDIVFLLDHWGRRPRGQPMTTPATAAVASSMSSCSPR